MRDEDYPPRRYVIDTLLYLCALIWMGVLVVGMYELVLLAGRLWK